MNYSKKGIEHKQHYIKSTSRRLVSKTRISLFRVFIVFVVFIAIVGSFAGFGFIKGLADSAPDISYIDVIPTGFTTLIYDREGNVMERLAGAEANRVYVSMDEIADVVKKAFVAIEDERFYEHDGIDVRGIFRAFFLGLSKGGFDQGASTITQQLLKNQVFNGGRERAFADRVERKIQEQYLAIQLEDKLEKDMILEYYLNTINLGSGTFGIQTASQRYFKKNASELNLSEAAVIAAITQLPVYLNPITYPERNAARRAEVLIKMYEQGYVTREEYEEAIEDDVYARIQTVNEEKESSIFSYFVEELITEVIADLQSELGMTQNQAWNLIYSGGLSIYTTQDPTIQRIADEVYADESLFPEMGRDSFWELTYALSISKNDEEGTIKHYHSRDLLEYYKNYPDPNNLYVDDNGSKFSLLFIDRDDMQAKIDEFRESLLEEGDIVEGEKITMTIQPQSSFVVMDQYTGHVKAIIGGRGEKQGNRTLNRATSTVRLPGSTFKVLSTFLPALDTAGFTLASVQDDVTYFYPNTTTPVRNWNTRSTFEGLSSYRRAIYNSMNIVTVKALAEVTPQVGFDYLQRLGFTTLVESRTQPDGKVVSDINLPMALGGLTDGVTNLELTAAYAAIANGGIYTKPILYTKIIDHNGKVLLDKKTRTEQVMKESTAWLLTNAMEDTVKVGTGKAYRLTTVNMPVAGKTGSTSDYNDLWFSGYTPYYTATIWSGFDNNRTQGDRNYQRHIWRTIMERIHSEMNLETKSFTMPDSIVTAKICSKSGKLAVDGLCDKALGGDTTRIEFFAKGTVPTEKCDVHVRVKVCTETKALATDFCPASSVKEVVYLNKREENETLDTPNVLPTGPNASCTIHTSRPPSRIEFNLPNLIQPPGDDETLDLNNMRQFIFE